MEINKKNILISGITTSLFMLGKFILKNGEVKKLLICTTQQEADGLLASAFSGIVNNKQVPEKRLSPISFTLYNSVHEQLILLDKNNETIRIDFEIYPYQIFDYQRFNREVSLKGDFKPWPIFGFNDFKKSIKAKKIWIWQIPWLKGMLVYFHNDTWGKGEGHFCIYDTLSGSLQVIEEYEIEIDLRKVTLTSSETSYKNGRFHRKFFDGQGEDSHLILIPTRNPFEDVAYQPDSHSKTGLVEVKPPKMLAGPFNAFDDPPYGYCINDKKGNWIIPITLSNGNWVREEHT